MAESDLLYKIMTLYILSRADFPVTNKIIGEFFIDRGYTDYFNVQKAIGSLLDTGMIAYPADVKTRDRYVMTAEGIATLELYKERITEAIDADVKDFFKEKGLEMRRESQVSADFTEAPSGGYYVHCSVSEGSRVLAFIRLYVTDKAQAEAICINWRIRYSDVYATLLDELI